jgi:hypothetical protein
MGEQAKVAFDAWLDRHGDCAITDWEDAFLAGWAARGKACETAIAEAHLLHGATASKNWLEGWFESGSRSIAANRSLDAADPAGEKEEKARG